MEEEYSYWIVTAITCEGNERWSTWRAPADFNDYDIENHIQLGGCGDDPAEIVSIVEAYCVDPDDASHYIWERD